MSADSNSSRGVNIWCLRFYDIDNLLQYYSVNRKQWGELIIGYWTVWACSLKSRLKSESSFARSSLRLRQFWILCVSHLDKKPTFDSRYALLTNSSHLIHDCFRTAFSIFFVLRIFGINKRWFKIVENSTLSQIISAPWLIAWQNFKACILWLISISMSQVCVYLSVQHYGI